MLNILSGVLSVYKGAALDHAIVQDSVLSKGAKLCACVPSNAVKIHNRKNRPCPLTCMYPSYQTLHLCSLRTSRVNDCARYYIPRFVLLVLTAILGQELIVTVDHSQNWLLTLHFQGGRRYQYRYIAMGRGGGHLPMFYRPLAAKVIKGACTQQLQLSAMLQDSACNMD